MGSSSSRRKLPVAELVRAPPGESGVRGHARLPRTPPSGVRQAPVRDDPARGAYIPPRPDFDSEPQLTQVQAPDPSLIAMARGARSRRRPRLHPVTWFALGALFGVCVAWSANSDVASDVYRARLAIADSLRSLHALTSGEPPALLPSPAPAPTVSVPPPAPPPVAPATGQAIAPAPPAARAPPAPVELPRAPNGPLVTITPNAGASR